MRIFSKTKATLALLAAVLVAGFAFAKTVEVTNVVWDEGKTFDVVERGTIELTGITAAVGDKLVITYEKAGAAAQEEARAAVPMRDVKKDADIWVFVGATTGDPAEKFEAIEGAGTKEYTFTQAIEATTIVELSARNLTITKVEVVSGIEVAEQLTNSDFSQGAALDNHLCGYGKDMAAQNTTYYGLQDVDGWTKVVVNGDNSSASFPNSGMGGGVFAYGSDWQMKGNNVKAPAAGPDGAAGQALGFFAVWGLGGYYYQDIALPAGKYTFMTYIYNQSGTQANTTQTGFFVDGVAKATVAINTAVGQWTLQTADFELTEETIGQVRVGYVSTGSGSAANPMLFFDYVKVLSELDAAVEAYNAALEAANAASDAVVTGEEQQTFNAAIAANSNIDMTSLDAVKAATEALKSAIEAYNTAKADYQALADAKALIDVTAWPYAAAAKKTAVEEALAATATSAADAVAKKDALLKAARTFIESNAIAEGVEGAQVIDDAITNPAAEDGTTGWTKTGDGSIDVKEGEPWTSADNNATHKYFDGGNWGASSWNTTFAQDITVASGKYVLTAIVRASANVALTLFAGEEKKQATVMGASGNVFDRGWNDVFVEFTSDLGGTVKIGVQGVTSNLHEWMSFSNFRLVRIADTEEGAALANALEALNAEIAAAQALLADETKTEGRDELQAAIVAAQALLTSTDAAAITDGVQALQEAEAAFKAANVPVQEGVYYVYNAYAKKFMSRGAAWGTQAVGDDYGLPINLVLDQATTTYKLQMLDNGVYYGDDYWMYADCSGDRERSYSIEAVEGGFYLHNTARDVADNRVYVYMKDDENKWNIAGNAILGDNISDEAQAVWQFMTKDERDAIVAEREAAEKNAAFESAGITAGDEQEAEATELTFATGSAWTFTAVRSGSSAATNENGTEVFQGSGNFTQTVENLEQGLYKVSIQAFYRDGSNEAVAAFTNQGYNLSVAYLLANGTKVQVKSWGIDRASDVNPNSMAEAKALFDEGKYLSEGYAYVGEDGKLELTVATPSFIGAGWFIAGNVKYAKVDSKGEEPVEPITIPTTWNFSEWTSGDITETTTKDGLTIVVKEGKTVSIDGNNKTVDGVDYTQRLKLGGAGAADARNLNFVVPGDCKIEVVLTSSSSGTDRTLNIDAGTFGNTISTMPASGSGVTKEAYTYTGEPTTIYLYSVSSGINIYAIYVTEATPTGISSVEANRFAGNEVYNLRGQRVENPTKGLYIIGGKKVVIK